MRRKEGINIAPFVDVLLVLFVIVVAVASFDDGFKEQLLQQRQMNEYLKKKIAAVQKENRKLRRSVDSLKKEVESLHTPLIVRGQRIVTSTGEVFSLDDILFLLDANIIRGVNMRYYKDAVSMRTYKRLKSLLRKKDFEFE